MIATWMLYSMLVGALMAGVASVLFKLRRNDGIALRWIWAGAMLTTIALSVSAPWREQSNSVLPSGMKTTVVAVASTVPQAPTFIDRARTAFGDVTAASAAPFGVVLDAASRLPSDVHYVALLASLVSASLGLVALLVMYRRVLRMRGTWPLDSLLGAHVRVAPETGPAVIGLAPAEIVVPRWLLDRSAAEQRMVLEHEQSHVQARDPLVLLSACVAVACMPWNPALWYMLSRLRLAVELDCDRRVLRAGAPTRSYAHLLIELSQHPSLLTAAIPAFSHTASHLERRLLAMTARTSRSSVAVRLGGALLVGVALLAACESKLPTSAEIDGMTAASATKRVAEVTGIDTSKVSYMIDDRRVTKEEAEKLAAANIASIDVQGGKSSLNGSVVRIRTGQNVPMTNDSLARVEVSADGAMIRKIGPDSAAGGKLAAGNFRVLSRTPGSDSAQRIAIASSKVRTPFNGLLVIDGVFAKAGTDLDAISPDKIERIEVVKGPTARILYDDPRAANGVIVITTKK